MLSSNKTQASGSWTARLGLKVVVAVQLPWVLLPAAEQILTRDSS